MAEFPFELQVRFVRFLEWKRELPKTMLVQTAAGTRHLFKIAKPLRPAFLTLEADSQLTLAGLNICEKGTLRRVVTQVIAGPPLVMNTLELNRGKDKARVEICSRSNCWKNGGEDLFTRLSRMVEERGLEVEVAKTGCLGRCEHCPALRTPVKVYRSVRRAELQRVLQTVA
jgi:hypothetical protein